MSPSSLDEELSDLVQRHGFMPLLHGLRQLCEQEAQRHQTEDTPNERALFFRDFWDLASRNLAASELLLLQHVQSKP